MTATTKTTCYTIFKKDVKSSFFSLEECNGKVIDVRASFAPEPLWRTAVIRSIFFIFTVSTVIYDLIMTPEAKLFIHFGYLTNWGQVYVLIYQLSVLICTVKPSLLHVREDGTPGNMIRFLWSMYTVAASNQLTLSVLFWVLVYSPDLSITFPMISNHGITALLVLFDGNFVGHIAVRLKHFLLVELTAVIYVAWNMIHSYSGIGTNKVEQNENALYDFLNWKNETKASAIVVLAVLLVVIPMFFLVVWLLSLWSTCCKCNGSRRRTIKDERIAKELPV